MFFAASKILWFLAAPDNALLLLLAIGVVLLLFGRRRLGLTLTGGAAAVFVAILALPIDYWLIAPLENRFPAQPQVQGRVDGVVVLGGSLSPWLTAERGQFSLGDAPERLIYFLILAREHPEAKLVFTGGSGDLLDQSHREAPYVRELVRALGFDPARITFEENSRNTSENAILSKELAKPAPGERWLLVTSAYHMPRSVGVFRHAGWDVSPYPVDYHTGRRPRTALLANFADKLVTVTMAWREWVGLAAYRIFGKTDELFPGPR